MPTGYTSYIKDGKITSGKEFLKLCTRAFGIAIDLKDESLDVPTPNHFEPHPYYEKAYKDSVVSREKAYSMTFEEVKEDIISKYHDNKGRAAKILEEYKDEDKKYLKVREEINKWIQQGIEYFRENKDEYYYFTGSGNALVHIYRFDCDKEYYVVVSKDYESSDVEFEEEDYA